MSITPFLTAPVRSSINPQFGVDSVSVDVVSDLRSAKSTLKLAKSTPSTPQADGQSVKSE